MANLIPESVTLCIYDREARRYGVSWVTEDRGEPVLQYTKEDDTAFAHAVTVRAESSDSVGGYQNRAVIAGLEPGEQCRWRVGNLPDGGEGTECWSEDAVFRALSGREDTVEFFYMTDSQDDNHLGSWWIPAWKDARSRYPGCEFLVHGGDFVQLSGRRDYWREMTGINREFLRSVPMLPIAGNHDYWRCYLYENLSTFAKHVHIGYEEQDTTNGVYYSADIGPVHFTCLNSGDAMVTGGALTDQQMEFLTRDLASANRPWKIVCIHNPLYSPGKYGSDPKRNGPALALRAQLNRIFAENGVDLVLSGHDHMYFRSHPVTAEGEPQTDCESVRFSSDGTEGTMLLDPRGPVHFMAGCCGDQCRWALPDIPEEYSRFFAESGDMTEETVAYAAVRVEGDCLTLRYHAVSVKDGTETERRIFGIKAAAKFRGNLNK